MAKYTAEPSARVLADSISIDGHRLTTMEVTMHRFVLAEFNTHRVFSRNSASSRAIPGHVQRGRATRLTAMPSRFASKQSGMQGGADIPEEFQSVCERIWSQAAADAAYHARLLDQHGVHKSITNRLLEPFLFQTVIVTSTEWLNFFRQRDSELAQPEIAEPARLMREAYTNSDPKKVGQGEWHLPLLQHEDLIPLGNYTQRQGGTYEDFIANMRKVSAARCARVSYLTHDGKRDIEADIELYDRLVSADPPHWSPLEHVATPCKGHYDSLGKRTDNHLGNFDGWDQLRHLEGT